MLRTYLYNISRTFVNWPRESNTSIALLWVARRENTGGRLPQGYRNQEKPHAYYGFKVS